MTTNTKSAPSPEPGPSIRAVKIVYEGPGMAGKTANLVSIQRELGGITADRLVRLATATERTLFFDMLTLDYRSAGGDPTRTRLYTVPGQVFYDGARRLLLDGVDAVVFVADSEPERFAANGAALRRLEANLRNVGLDPAQVPGVLQLNKRDAPGAMRADHLADALNRHGWPVVEAEALGGRGVLQTLSLAHRAALRTGDRGLTPCEAAEA